MYHQVNFGAPSGAVIFGNDALERVLAVGIWRRLVYTSNKLQEFQMIDPPF